MVNTLRDQFFWIKVFLINNKKLIEVTSSLFRKISAVFSMNLQINLLYPQIPQYTINSNYISLTLITLILLLGSLCVIKMVKNVGIIFS